MQQVWWKMAAMRFRVAVCAWLLSGTFLIAHSKISRHVVRADDPTYAPALAAANRFLHAWQTQDREAGIMMLTDAARQHASEEKLDEFFSTGPQAAFEIQHGKRVKNGQYVFPVTLFGASDAASRPHAGSIVITKAAKGDWAVERLP